MRADFHIHSKFSDGDSNPVDIVKMAIDLGLDAVGVVDHVNANSDWIEDFSSVMDSIKKRYGDRLEVLCGLEAKCASQYGDLDIPVGAHRHVDYVVGAMHRVPRLGGYMPSNQLKRNVSETLFNWKTSVDSMLKNPIVDVWAHPGRILALNGIAVSLEIWSDLSLTAASCNKYAEVGGSRLGFNIMPTDMFLRNGVRLIPASDSHSLEDMSEYSRDGDRSPNHVLDFLQDLNRRR